MKYNKAIIIGITRNDGSNSQQFQELGKYCSQNGWTVIFISDQHKGQSTENDKIIYLSWPSTRPTKLKDFIFYFKLLQEYKPEVTLSNFSSVNIMVIVGKILGVKKIICWYRTVIEISQLSFKGKFQIFRKSIIYGLSNKIILVSEYLRPEVKKFFKVPDSKIEVIGNSVAPLDPNKIVPIALRKKQILCVGGLYPWKGQKVLLEAFSNLASTFIDFTLVFVGGGPDEITLKNYSDKLNLNKRVLFLGHRPPSEVRELLSKATVSVIPSLADSFNFVVIESLQVGTPVIGSKVGGIQLSLDDNKTGLLFKPNDGKSLEKKLKTLLSDVNLQENMQDEIIQSFNGRFSWDIWIKNITKKILE